MTDPALGDELKGQLTVIIGHCEMLQVECSNHVDMLARLEAIKTVALRMAERISNYHPKDASDRQGDSKE